MRGKSGRRRQERLRRPWRPPTPARPAVALAAAWTMHLSALMECRKSYHHCFDRDRIRGKHPGPQGRRLRTRICGGGSRRASGWHSPPWRAQLVLARNACRGHERSLWGPRMALHGSRGWGEPDLDSDVGRDRGEPSSQGPRRRRRCTTGAVHVPGESPPELVVGQGKTEKRHQSAVCCALALALAVLLLRHDQPGARTFCSGTARVLFVFPRRVAE